MKNGVIIASKILIKYYTSYNSLYNTQIPKFHLTEITDQNKKWALKYQISKIFTSCLVILNCLCSHFAKFQSNWLWIGKIAEEIPVLSKKLKQTLRFFSIIRVIFIDIDIGTYI